MSAVPTASDKELQNIDNSNIPPVQNKKRKRKNKNKKKNKQLIAKKKFNKHKPGNSGHSNASKIVFTMSSWAEQFTFAATWQLKHQLAYWKAKAKSLEYENGVLHEIIRKNHSVRSRDHASGSGTYKIPVTDEERKDLDDAMHINKVKKGKLGEWEKIHSKNSQTMSVDLQSESEDEDCLEEKQNIEVSEEFIQFLMINAKHKEEMRLERQKMLAAEEQAVMEERESKLQARRHYGLSGQELYGDKWQRISALEMSMKSNFMSNIDSNKPAYWPVIPFNFDLHYSYENQQF